MTFTKQEFQDAKLPYTVIFIRRRGSVLLLNREKNPWRGRWNGVGGKIEPGETPEQGAVRECQEETGITIKEDELISMGKAVWIQEGKIWGMYVYLVDMPHVFRFDTPKATPEGILDWKQIEWITNANPGIVSNLKDFFTRESWSSSDLYFLEHTGDQLTTTLI